MGDMEAIQVMQFGGPEVLKVVTLPTPEPGAGQVLVRLHAAGVNPVETYVRSGVYATLPKLPYTPGSDGAGVVEAVGEGVTTAKVGDRVYTCRPATGTYATHCLAGADQVRPLPEGVTFAQGAALYVPYYTAYRAVFVRGGVQPGETVLVHGATGGVGLACLQWLKGMNVKVIATAGSDRGIELVRAQGAAHVFNHREAEYVNQIKAVGPVDCVLEMLANVNLKYDLEMLGYGGRVVVIGNRGETTINARGLMPKDADIRGMILHNATPAELNRMHQAVAQGLISGQLSPVIAHRLALTEGPRAHELVMQSGALGKIVLIP